MTLRLALRSLAMQPVRSAVLACGFGAGIAAMAGLLGVGEVILEQSRAPALAGGGDLVVSGASGEVRNARFLVSNVLRPSPTGEVEQAAPRIYQRLFLVDDDGATLPIHAQGGIPSLDRALGDPETSSVATWLDTGDDAAWASPDPESVLRAMDRFHAIPDVPERADSWAEWLYFNGRSDDVRFYLTFLVGPRVAPDRRSAAVRLQLERAGVLTTYSAGGEVDASEVLERAPDLEIAGCRVSLEGPRYRIRLALFEERESRIPDDARAPDLTGELVLEGLAGGSMPPFRIRGRSGWVTGYVVPVLSGALAGELRVDGEALELDGGTGYHDHNWGFWEGVTWRWGQVASGDLSFVYGRILPPADVADAERFPGLLVALGPEGPVGFATDVRIQEVDAPADGGPRQIRVSAHGPSLELRMELDVEEAIRTRLAGGPRFGDRPGSEFLQLRATYRVSGRLGDRRVEFTAEGAAETFRNAAATAPAND